LVEEEMVMSVNAGFVGCGSIAGSHLRAYVECGARVVAVTDANTEAARKMGNETGADVFEDFKQLLDVARPDVISICTPPVAHEEAAVYALAKGGSRPVREAVGPQTGISPSDT